MRVIAGSSVLFVVLLLSILLLSAVCFGQLPSSRCDSTKSALEECSFLTPFESPPDKIFGFKKSSLDHSAVLAESSEPTTGSETASREAALAPVSPAEAGLSLAPSSIGIVYFSRNRAGICGAHRLQLGGV